MNDKVKCAVCGHEEHILIQHILRKHKLEPVAYMDKYPSAPLWSSYGYAKIQKHNKAKAAAYTPRPRESVPMKQLFPDFGKFGGMELTGTYDIFATPGPYTPTLDPNYVFPEEQTLDLLTILEKKQRNRPYIAGYSGTGKTQLVFNVAAICNAEVMEWNADSYQERSSLIGGWVVREHHVTYRRPVVYGDVVLVTTIPLELGGVKGTRRTEIRRESDGVLVTEALTEWVWIRVSNGRPSRVPAELVALLEDGPPNAEGGA